MHETGSFGAVLWPVSCWCGCWGMRCACKQQRDRCCQAQACVAALRLQAVVCVVRRGTRTRARAVLSWQGSGACRCARTGRELRPRVRAGVCARGAGAAGRVALAGRKAGHELCVPAAVPPPARGRKRAARRPHIGCGPVLATVPHPVGSPCHAGVRGAPRARIVRCNEGGCDDWCLLPSSHDPGRWVRLQRLTTAAGQRGSSVLRSSK